MSFRAMVAADLARLHADPNGPGVEVRYGRQRTRGTLATDYRLVEDGSGGTTQVAVTVLRVVAGALRGIKKGAAITVEGVDYTIREHGPTGQGVRTEILLAET